MIERLVLSPALRDSLSEGDPFDHVLALTGETRREHKHRRTFRCEIGNEAYFIKIHGRTGWGEIVKNVARGRWPTLTALPEWRALERLHVLGVPTMTGAGVGVRGHRPAWTESFLITHELKGMVHLDAVAREWRTLVQPLRLRLQRAAIGELASIARAMHLGGVNHRDFYLCHFMLPEQDVLSFTRGSALSLHVIDLHRARIRRRTPARWMMKDLSGLLFSALDEGLSPREFLRFWRVYRHGSWREDLSNKRGFLRRIIRRAKRLYASEHGRPAPLPASLASF